MNEITLRRITLQDVPALSLIAKKTFFDTFTGTCTEDDMDHFLEKYYNESECRFLSTNQHSIFRDIESGGCHL